MNQINADHPPARGARLVQALVDNRWLAAPGIPFWGGLAILAAVRSAWVLLGADLALAAVAGTSVLLRSALRRKAQAFDTATLELDELPPLPPGAAGITIQRRP